MNHLVNDCGPFVSNGPLASTGEPEGLIALVVLGVVLAAAGLLLVVYARRVRVSHRSAILGVGGIALIAGLIAVPGLTAAPAQAVPAAIQAHCTATPSVSVDKGDPGDDRHHVDAGDHNITTKITNTGDEALTGFTFGDKTEQGAETNWNAGQLAELSQLTLAPGSTFEVRGTVHVAAGEIHRDTVFITAQGVVSGKDVAADDSYTLTTDPALLPASTAPPAVVEACNVEPTVTPAASEGVIYSSERAGDELIITATAAPGYVLADGQQSQWVIDMGYDTSEWNDDAWALGYPEAWTGYKLLNPGVWPYASYYFDQIVPMSEQLNPILMTTDDLNAYSTDWLGEAQAAGATLTLGSPKVETYGYTADYTGFVWTEISVSDVPPLEIIAGDPAADDRVLQQTRLRPQLVNGYDYGWVKSPGFGFTVLTRYTWPLTLSVESPRGTCTQSTSINLPVDVYSPAT